MKEILINSLSPDKIIQNIAEQLDTKYTILGDECKIHIPANAGTGIITAIRFIDGLSMMNYDCTFNQDLEVRFLTKDVHPLKLLYCLKGELEVRVENMDSFETMEKYHSVIMASEGKSGHVFRFPAGQAIDLRSVEIDRARFRNRYNSSDRRCHHKLQKIFDDHKAEGSFYHDGLYSVSLSDLFEEIDEYRHGGIIRSVFLEGKVLEILSHQLILYEDDLNGKNKQGILRQHEMGQIQEATNIIDDELEDICTVPELAHRVGLNVNKLQEGFKAVYKMTVNQYVHKTRMEHATHFLKYSDLNVSEIVNKVGLNSKSYFSKIFKEAYQLTPTQYRKEKRKKVV